MTDVYQSRVEYDPDEPDLEVPSDDLDEQRDLFEEAWIEAEDGGAWVEFEIDYEETSA